MIWHPFVNVQTQDHQLLTPSVCTDCGMALSIIMLTPGHGLTTSSSTCKLDSSPLVE